MFEGEREGVAIAWDAERTAPTRARWTVGVECVQQVLAFQMSKAVVPRGFEVKRSDGIPAGLPEKMGGKSQKTVMGQPALEATVRTADVDRTVTDHQDVAPDDTARDQ